MRDHLTRTRPPLQPRRLLQEALNSKGYTTKSWTTVKGQQRAGQPWHKGLIHKILTRPLYLGQVRHKDKIYPGEHEAIIDQRLWNEAKQILGENGHGRGNQTKAKSPGLLT